MSENRVASTSAPGRPVLASLTASGQAGARPPDGVCPDGRPATATATLSVAGQAGPSSTDGSPAARLSGREREVLVLLAEGASNPEIAVSLFISVNTVERHVTNICAKLGARGRTAAVARAIRDALI